MKKIIANITVVKFDFSKMAFREIHALTGHLIIEPKNQIFIVIMSNYIRSSIYWTQNQNLFLCPVYRGSDNLYNRTFYN